MALNRFMHPRNPYKKMTPDFHMLAVKYPEFRKCVFKDMKGKMHIDYKSPATLRQLSITLLKENFDLDVEIPLNRLIPTIPLRMNYILWIEDILNGLTEINGRGIDIGTGSSCVYPLLGCKKNNWKFLATELDDTNLAMAVKNVKKNNMDEKIIVKKVYGESVLSDVLEGNETHYDFCMCNPPFFADHMDAQAINSTRSDSRAEPSSISTACFGESITQGGEVAFVKKIILESLELKDRVKVFTSMIGKKSNVPLIKKELKELKIPNYQSTEFCQGNTMRWGIAWTFDESVVFPRSLFQENKKSKKLAAPMTYPVPFDAVETYDVDHITLKVTKMLQDLKIEFERLVDEHSTIVHMTLTAFENTWSHQRRKRREMKRKSGDGKTEPDLFVSEHTTDCNTVENLNTTSVDIGKINSISGKEITGCENTVLEKEASCGKVHEEIPFKGRNPSYSEIFHSQNELKRKLLSYDENGENLGQKKFKADEQSECSNEKNASSNDGVEASCKGRNPNYSETVHQKNKMKRKLLSDDENSDNLRQKKFTAVEEAECSNEKIASSDDEIQASKSFVKSENNSCEQTINNARQYLIKCKMNIKVMAEAINIEMIYVDGQKDLMQQILQYIKNHMTKSD